MHYWIAVLVSMLSHCIQPGHPHESSLRRLGRVKMHPPEFTRYHKASFHLSSPDDAQASAMTTEPIRCQALASFINFGKARGVPPKIQTGDDRVSSASVYYPLSTEAH